MVGSISSFAVQSGDGYLAMSGTGQYLIGKRDVGINSPTVVSQIAFSGNYGASTTISSVTVPYLKDVQVSVTGQYMLASTNGDGKVYTSSDYGNTWTTHLIACDWVPAATVAISSTGQYMAAGSNWDGSTCGATGFFSVSSDYGASWTRRSATLCWQRIVFVSVSTSDAASGVMIVATGNVLSNYACTTSMTVMKSLDLGLTWTTLSSTAVSPTIPMVPGGAVSSIAVFYQVTAGDTLYKFATVTVSSTSLSGVYGCPYLPTASSSNSQVFVAIDSAGSLRFSSVQFSMYLTTWSSAIIPASGTACSSALLTGDGMSVTTFCGTNVYRSTVTIAPSPATNSLFMQPTG